jgi:hypothetical protein
VPFCTRANDRLARHQITFHSTEESSSALSLTTLLNLFPTLTPLPAPPKGFFLCLFLAHYFVLLILFLFLNGRRSLFNTISSPALSLSLISIHLAIFFFFFVFFLFFRFSPLFVFRSFHFHFKLFNCFPIELVKPANRITLG